MNSGSRGCAIVGQGNCALGLVGQKYGTFRMTEQGHCSIGADAPATAFGKTILADFASARNKNGTEGS